MAYKDKIIINPSICVVLLLGFSALAMANDALFKTSLDNFSRNIFSELFKSKGQQSIICSTFSIQTALTMLRSGAEGRTAVEMDNGLTYTGQPLESIVANYHTLLAKYENSHIFKTANKVFVKYGRELKDEYNEVLSKNFFSTAEPIDFTQKLEAANIINSWVESKTNNTIKDMVSASSLTKDTVLFLLSASYFKGEWVNAFKEMDTKERDFYLDETRTIKVPMMYGGGKRLFGKIDVLDATAVRLPYKDSDLSMMIILPNKKTGLVAMVDQMKHVPFQLLMEKTRGYQSVKLHLPKFRVEFKIELSKTLINMGMKQMFQFADFGKILKSPVPIAVSQVIHKAFIEVNEHGTKAAAATGINVKRITSVPPPPIAFNVDHPFYYVILNEDAVPLFQGTFTGL